jgi:hypothetical protein
MIGSMTGCASQIFSGVTVSHFEAIARKASELAGVELDAVSGSYSKSGFTFAWEYDPGEHTLMIQCTASPFSVSCGAINARVHDLVDSAAAQ